MNVPYLLKILKTDKLSELVANIDLPPIDINLALWDAVKLEQIKIKEHKNRVKLLVDPEISFDSDLAHKLFRVIEHYASQEINVSRGTLNHVIKDPTTGLGYPWHEYLMALQYLIDTKQVLEMAVNVPKEGKRPRHKFVFLCLPDNPNEDWNRREINKWIANFNKAK
jgi:hypothetical protein